MQPKLSVIVPVYNVEKYLCQCLDSLIQQTLKDIEIICVNDGSVDGSLEILNDYAAKDNRISIISKENGGLSSARNMGMQTAKGVYIGFVDSDDWVNPTMFEKLYNKAVKFNAEMAMCGINQIDDESGSPLPTDTYFNLALLPKYLDERSFSIKNTTKLLFRLCVTAVNKIYKKSLIERIKPVFPLGLVFEDVPFFYDTYINARSVVLVREALYYYRKNRDGATTSRNNDKFFQIVDIQNEIEKVFKKSGKEKKFRKQLLENKICSLMYTINRFDGPARIQYFKIVQDEFERLKLHGKTLKKLPLHVVADYLAVVNKDSFSYDEFKEARERIVTTLVHEMRSKNILLRKTDRFIEAANHLWSRLKKIRYTVTGGLVC